MGGRRSAKGTDPTCGPRSEAGTPRGGSPRVVLAGPDRPIQTPTPAPQALRAVPFSLWGESLVVFSYPLPRPGEAQSFTAGGKLTTAEGRVLELALQGYSNAAIAALRRVSARTIANQLASIYRKLGCSSRAEVARLLNRSS